MATKYRKKPVVVEAMQFTDLDSYLDVVAWWRTGKAKSETLDAHEKFEFRGGPTALMLINTLEGWMSAQPGDYIIKGTEGEFYPCKPAAFAATFEPA